MKAKGKSQNRGPAIRRGVSQSGRGEGGAGASVSPSSRKAAPASPSSRAASAAPRRAAKSRERGGSKSRGGSTRGVVIVGAGRLGTALARALDACGYEVRALVSRTAAHARRAAARAAVGAVALGVEQLEALPAAGLLFITTPDDRIAETAARLAALPGLRALDLGLPEPALFPWLPVTSCGVADAEA
ncbi:MAG TPA: NAD(P)-binding domain-containing protein, partial [Pyrinomonadaceae bacterium]